jgi:ABC-type Zn uptake system ZnuABC Zn-binding protein ZnuA
MRGKKHKLIPALLVALCEVLWGPQTSAEPAPAPEPALKVCATIPDLGDLAHQIGGDRVSVTVFAKGTEDPHFLEARPSFVKAASEADVLLMVGMELEVGWIPPIILNSRNPKIQSGQPGCVEVSAAITPLEVPTGVVDRSQGDVHMAGNPHFLVDPVCGIKVARLLAEKFGDLRPQDKAVFDENFKAFRGRVCDGLVGPELAKKYDAEKLALLAENGKLEPFLEAQGDRKLLGGWLGSVSGHAGVKAVADHNLWPYLARRYGVTIVGFMEPRPGVAPTTKHLRELVETMKRDKVGLILQSPYFDPRHAALVSKETGAKVVELAHQVSGRAGTDDYISMCDYNARQLAAAMKEGH